MTVSFACWPSKAVKGLAPIYLVIRDEPHRATRRLPFDVKPKDFHSGRVRKTNRNHIQINRYLAEIERRCEDVRIGILASGDRPSPEAIIAGALSERGESFIEYFESVIERLRNRKQWGTAEHYQVVLNKLQGFRKRVSFDDVDVSFVEGFKTHLIAEHGNNTNTVRKNLAIVRAVLYRAIREDKFPQEKNPFFRVRLKRDGGKKKRALTIDEFRRLESADLSGRRAEVRDAFVFAVYSAGVRVSDVLTLTHSDVPDRIEYSMRKTRSSQSVQLLPPAERILRRYGWPDGSGYIFPFMPNVREGSEEEHREIKKKTAIINKYLRMLSDELGITRMTSHVARFTFANLLDEADLPIQRIQDLLRHSDPQTTRVYLQSLQQGKHDEVMREVFGL